MAMNGLFNVPCGQTYINMNKERQIYIHDEKKNNKQYSDTNDIHNKKIQKITNQFKLCYE